MRLYSSKVKEEYYEQYKMQYHHDREADRKELMPGFVMIHTHTEIAAIAAAQYGNSKEQLFGNTSLSSAGALLVHSHGQKTNQVHNQEIKRIKVKHKPILRR